MNQVLFGVEESMELLSNRVWTLFSQELMEKSIDLLEGSRSTMEGGRDAPFYLGWAGVRKKRPRAVGKEGEGYKYPLAPNGHLSCGSAATQVRQCRTMVVPLIKCGSVAPRKTARAIVKCRLSWVWIWGCMWLLEHLVAHISLSIVSSFTVRFFLYSNLRYKRI